MDLGLKGKWAVVCGASSGLGYACAHALAEEGVNVVIAARTKETLEKSQASIRHETGVDVIAVVADVSRAEDRERLIAAAPVVDILVNNAGGPKPGDFREKTPDDWRTALEANMIAPIELIRITIDGMIADDLGVW